MPGREPCSSSQAFRVTGPRSSPTKQNLTKAQTAAYQAAIEAVFAVPIATGFGYWFDSSFETSPIGLAIGAVVGFAAMVLRLVRMKPGDTPAGEEEALDEARTSTKDGKQ